MMPSRGLHFARGNAPRLFQLQCRNLSSASRRLPLCSFRNNVDPSKRPAQWRTSVSALPALACSIRYASTTPQPPSSPPVQPTAETVAASDVPPAEQNTFPNLDTISLDGINLDPISQVPEKLGYLNEIGLNYGYGITSSIEWIVEHIHILGGLPWWGSVAATAVILRVAMFPLFLKSSDVMARSQALTSVTKPIQDKMQQAKEAGDQVGMQAAFAELLATRKRAGISFRGQLTPLFAQALLAFCGFRLVRAMATLPVPALTTDGPMWLQDLTLSDPYLILPAAMGGTIHLLVRMGGESGAAQNNAMNPGMQNFMLYGMPVITFVALGFQSGLVCVWFAAGGLISVTQSLLLQRPGVRKFFGIAPLFQQPKEAKSEDAAMLQMLNPWSNKSAAPEVQPVASPEASPVGTATGKNAVYMRPTYQSPKIRHHLPQQSPQQTSAFIDVKATAKNSQISTAAKPSTSTPQQPTPPSVSQEAAESWSEIKQEAQRRVKEKKAASGKKKRVDDSGKAPPKRKGKR